MMPRQRHIAAGAGRGVYSEAARRVMRDAALPAALEREGMAERQGGDSPPSILCAAGGRGLAAGVRPWKAAEPMDDDDILHSPLERSVTRDDITVRIRIYRGAEDPGWLLEVEDHLGGSTV